MSKALVIYLLTLLLFSTACNSFHKAQRKHNKLSDRELLMISSAFIEATRYKILGDAANAMGLYQTIIEQDPLHDASLYELARLKMLNGETDMAVDLLKTAIRVDPDNIWYKLAYAGAFEKSGKYSEAAIQYKNLRNKYPEKYELYEYEAQCYIQNNEFQKAIDVYNEIELQTGITEQIGIQKYYIYQNWSKTDKAMNEVQKLADHFPENPQYSMALVEYYMRTGRAGLALNSINAVLTVDPENALAHAYLADYYHMSGNDSLAVKEIFYIIGSVSTGIDEKISLLMNVYRAGNVYGDTTVVYPMLDTLVSVHADEAKAWAMYADFLNADDRMDEAMVMWKKSLEFDKSVFTIWNLMMNVFYDNQQYDSLLTYASEAAELFPEQSSVWFFLGLAQYHAAMFEKAVVSLEFASDLRLSNKEMKNESLFLLADTYAKTGRNDDSDAMFEKLIGEDPDNVVAKNAYAYSLALRKNNIDRAQQLIAEALTGNEDKAEFQHTYGLVLFRLGKYLEAAEAYRKAIELGGDDDGALLEHYADVLFFQNKTEDALHFWLMARELGGVGKMIDQKITDKKYYE
ncbi:MAG: tetratricopeptide repeat protein [Bacteroidales bacterium]|jgi:tetratricopeptide (TPR) repeat protein|nr:tetratricopeptide repeat protein [Bacteroidales bacterium]